MSTDKHARHENPAQTKTTVLLDPELAAWAKAQPGGLSKLVRRLLSTARQNEESGRVTALLSERSLAKIWDTPEEDEAWRDL